MKEIDGFPGYYVTEYGSVWSNKGKMFKRRKLQTNNKGYKMVILVNGEGRRGRLVSRLVLAAYKEHPEGKDYCNHMNGVKDDNHISNLEWCTREENNRHSIEVLGNRDIFNPGRGRENHRAIRYTIKDGNGERHYETLKEAVKSSGYSAYHIYNSLKYGNKLHVDYVWSKEQIHGTRKKGA